MHKETVVKAVDFDFPSTVPVVLHINQACWDSYDRDFLAKLVETHPCLFPDGVPEFVKSGGAVPYPDWCREDVKRTYPWGCVWETRTSGFVGTVVDHPIKDLDTLSGFEAPDPDKTTYWYPVTWKHGVSPANESILTYGLYPQTPPDNIAVMMDFLEDVASGGTPWIN